MVAAVVLVVVLVSFLSVWFGGGVVLRIGVGDYGPRCSGTGPWGRASWACDVEAETSDT